jgi:hypothetical protein
MESALENLIGATILSVEGMEAGSTDIRFLTDKGTFRLYYIQSCCESVRLVDVNGDPEDLVGGVVSVAEERSNQEHDDWGGRTKWTFYTIRTSKGDVDLRWLGQDNGYYGVSVDHRWYLPDEEISDW